MPTPALSEEELRPVKRINIAIIDHDEIPSPDGKTVTVSGTPGESRHKAHAPGVRPRESAQP
jgi:hypothetical protein